MKQEYYTCDNCGIRVDYTDSDCDSYVSGLTIKTRVEFKLHVPTSYGNSGGRVNDLDLENICSPSCLREVFDKTVMEFEKAWASKDVDIVNGELVAHKKD